MVSNTIQDREGGERTPRRTALKLKIASQATITDSSYGGGPVSPENTVLRRGHRKQESCRLPSLGKGGAGGNASETPLVNAAFNDDAVRKRRGSGGGDFSSLRHRGPPEFTAHSDCKPPAHIREGSMFDYSVGKAGQITGRTPLAGPYIATESHSGLYSGGDSTAVTALEKSQLALLPRNKQIESIRIRLETINTQINDSTVDTNTREYKVREGGSRLS